MSAAFIPACILFVLGYALYKRTDVYGAFVEGAADALRVIVRILPYMAAMLIALNAFRSSGAMAALIRLLSPILEAVQMPAELVPLAVLRPFSGSASLAILSDLYAQYGPDSFIGLAASVMMGSSETIFYTVALYFGAVSVTKTRHAVPAALLSGIIGTVASLVLSHWFWS